MDIVGQRLRALMAGLTVVAVAATAAPLVASTPAEDDLKAAYIFNFIKFVDWPSEQAATTIRVDVIEDEPLATALRHAVEGKLAKNRSVTVRSDRRQCDSSAEVCVVRTTTEGAIALQLDQVKARPVLTIGDSPRFNQLGGIIQLRVADGRLRFQINDAAASANGLTISGRLIVLTEGAGGRR